MELKRYFQILLRYWWLVAIFAVIGIVLSYQAYKSTNDSYSTQIKLNFQRSFTLSDAGGTPQVPNQYADYYRFISSEYFLDDYGEVVKGNLFLRDVSKYLADKGDPITNQKFKIDAEELKGTFSTERKHRELTFTINAVAPDRALGIARGIGAVLEAQASKYLAPLTENRGIATPPDSTTPYITAKIIDTPVNAPYNSGRNLLLSATRGIVALIIGIGLAFLLSYLDTRLRTPAEFKEALGLEIVGAIPAKSMLSRFGGKKSGPTPPTYPPAVGRTEPEREPASRN